MAYRRNLPNWLVAILLTLLSSGCVGHVVPPGRHTLEEPVEVYLLDHGRHSSLVLPRGQGGFVRYSYGDWRWYVEGCRHFAVGAAAMLWPTEAGLGRGIYPDIEPPERFRRLAPEGLVEIHTLPAEASRVRRLQKHLDGYFERAGSPPVSSEEYGLEFVRHPRDYSATHQSNLVVARWLRELGFEVRGVPWFSLWRVDAPSSRRSPAR